MIEPNALKTAAKMAYKMADIDHPKSHIDLVEQSACSSDQEALFCEGLGFSEAGQGYHMILENNFINPSGGSLKSHPGFVAGASRVGY